MEVDVVPLSELEVQRHDTLYIASGDVILAAEKDETAQLFRVHKAVLAHNSPVFEDMFAFPSDGDLNETYDDIPVVRMHDKAEDLEWFLETFYEPAAFQWNRFDPDFPVKIRGLLNLATKYQVDSIRERIVHHLESDWPTSAIEWVRQREVERSLQEGEESFYHALCPDKAEDNFLEPASVIRLAHDFNIPAVLPAAYLMLAHADPTTEWDKEVRHGRQVPRGARWTLLDSSDMLRLAQGKQVLQYYCIWILNNVIPAEADSYDGCLYKLRPRARTCQQIVDQKSSEYRDSYMTLLRLMETPDCIEMLIGLRAQVPQWKICMSCERLIHSRVGNEIKKVWDSLPEFFRLVPEENDDDDQ